MARNAWVKLVVEARNPESVLVNLCLEGCLRTGNIKYEN
jgi:hypothetical protein